MWRLSYMDKVGIRKALRVIQSVYMFPGNKCKWCKKILFKLRHTLPGLLPFPFICCVFLPLEIILLKWLKFSMLA